MTHDADEKTRENVVKYGCGVIHVAAEDDLAPFAYSIGITHTQGAPEILVIGLRQELAHSIVNDYHQRIKDGTVFAPGKPYSGFLGGFDVFFEEVPLSAFDEYFGHGIDFYSGTSFKVMQLIWPTTKGVFPWDEGAPEGFRKWQPVLSRL